MVICIANESPAIVIEIIREYSRIKQLNFSASSVVLKNKKEKESGRSS